MKKIIKRAPLLPKSGKKDTLFSDLLRSEPRFEKDTLFWEFSDSHVNTYRESAPPSPRANRQTSEPRRDTVRFHLTTFGQEYWQGGHIGGGRVNAQVFSFLNYTNTLAADIIYLHDMTVLLCTRNKKDTICWQFFDGICHA